MTIKDLLFAIFLFFVVLSFKNELVKIVKGFLFMLLSLTLLPRMIVLIFINILTGRKQEIWDDIRESKEVILKFYKQL